MTVRFEFEMSDADAETLIDVLRCAKTRALYEAGKCIAKGSEKQAGWFNRHAAYIDGLRATVAAGSTRVE
jgi:hypothetical protein